MIIAVNTKHFSNTYQQVYSKFLYECFSRFIKEQPQHTFIFFSDTAFDHQFNFSGKNIFHINPKSQFKNWFGVLYRIKIAFLLKKHKADVYLNTDILSSSFSKIPECFIAEPLECVPAKRSLKKNAFLYKILLQKVLKKAKVIIVNSNFSKQNLIKQYKGEDKKIDVVYQSASDVAEEIIRKEKEKIKEQYSNGNEFFIFKGAAHNSIILYNLLKAFSLFKKWQKSSMQLIIIEEDKLPEKFFKSLNLFKYKNDVKVLNDLSENQLEKITASAYCVIYSPLYQSFDPALKAFLNNVPVITESEGAMDEICADAALYANFYDAKDISEKLMVLYKDEKLRQSFIEKGKKQIQNFTWKKTSDQLWASIIKATN